LTAEPAKQRPRRAPWFHPLLCAALCTLAAFGWQALKVHREFGGNWTGLFETGRDFPPPPALAAEHILIVSDTTGYDGQFCHYIAHDPFFRHGLDRAIDFPRQRYGRILIPLAAWLLAAGRQNWIDPAYHAVLLGFVFLGAYWCARRGLALLFLFLPATLLSIENSTIDVALLALCAGFLLFHDAPARKLLPILMLAPLVRETGALLIAAAVGAALLRKQWGRAALFAAAALPWLAWIGFVWAHTIAQPYPITAVPLSDAASALLHVRSPLPGLGGVLLTILERSTAVGSVLAAFLGLWQLRRPGPVTIACALFGLLGILLQRPDVWVNYHAHTRVLSPLYLLLNMSPEVRPLGAARASLVLVLPRFLVSVFVQLPVLL
jgi:hypothetical protein